MIGHQVREKCEGKDEDSSDKAISFEKEQSIGRNNHFEESCEEAKQRKEESGKVGEVWWH